MLCNTDVIIRCDMNALNILNALPRISLMPTTAAVKNFKF